MATSYYIMKMCKNQNRTNIDDYYSLLPKNYFKEKDTDSKCRVCLQKGTTSIFSDENIVEALQHFGEIEINEDDKHPKLLCDTCLKFIKTAIIFRNVAKRSDEILREPIKEESFNEHSQDSHDDYSDSNQNYDTKDTPKWANTNTEFENFSEIKKEKKEKIKFASKVTCHICNKVINRSYYKEHITMHDPDHKKYVCDVCGKSFRLRCAYHNHSLRHRNDFPFNCTFCPYKARYAELLKTHMRTHTGDYRYMCTECPARFLFKSNLNSHMLKHKEPQYKCDSCKRAFHTKLALQRHFEADHLGIKNHVCNMCGKAFGYRNAMMKHQRHVHKREKLLFGRMPSYLVAEHKKD